jgi:hypothetical protein
MRMGKGDIHNAGRQASPRARSISQHNLRYDLSSPREYYTGEKDVSLLQFSCGRGSQVVELSLAGAGVKGHTPRWADPVV